VWQNCNNPVNSPSPIHCFLRIASGSRAGFRVKLATVGAAVSRAPNRLALGNYSDFARNVHVNLIYLTGTLCQVYENAKFRWQPYFLILNHGGALTRQKNALIKK
jgi:hypothetical protein